MYPYESFISLEQDVQWDRLNLRRYWTASAFFTVVLDAIFYPLEMMKTRLQVQGLALTSSCPPYGGTLDVTAQVFRQEGFLAYWKGFSVSLLASAPSMLSYYGSYEYARYHMIKSVGGGSTLSDLHEAFISAMAGSIAEITSGLVWCPGDLVSQRLMLQGPQKERHLYRNGKDAVRQIVRAEGIAGLYVGYVPGLWTHIPTSAISWAVYEHTKKALYRYRGEHDRRAHGSIDVTLTAAFVSGVVSAWCVTPMDVIRVRMQTQGHDVRVLRNGLGATSVNASDGGLVPPKAARAQRKYLGTWSGLRTIYAEEGVRGLFRGSVLRMLQAAPMNCITLLGYEAVKSFALLRD